MQLRRATPDDLTAIADVILASLTDDSSWKSLFTSDIRSDPDCDYYARELLSNYLDPDNPEWLVLVAELPKGGTYTIASVAIWNISLARYQNTRRDSAASTICDVGEVVEVMSPDNYDSTMDKLTGLHTTISFSQKKYFQHLEPCIYLEVLATHPVYRGKGYAKALCTEVVESAQKRDLPVAVLTSMRGYIFFSGLGFKDLGCVSLRGPKRALEDCVLKAMILCARQKKSRPLVVSWILTHTSK